jgi:hypothetical protein
MAAVTRNILEASHAPLNVFFVVERDDAESVAEAGRLFDENIVSVVNTRKQSYAGAVNTAVSALLDLEWEYFFLGADDLDFKPGWDTEALRAAQDGALVIGTNDLHNPYVLAGTHATHVLVHRDYVTDPRYAYDPDMAGQVMFEGYDHNFVDTEFVDAAKAAGVFTPCMTSVVEHLHPDWGLSPWDATYAKTRARIHDDHGLFRSREHLWTAHPDGRQLL